MDMERIAGLLTLSGAITFALSAIVAIVYSAGNTNHDFDRSVRAGVIGMVVGLAVAVIGAIALIVVTR